MLDHRIYLIIQKIRF